MFQMLLPTDKALSLYSRGKRSKASITYCGVRMFTMPERKKNFYNSGLAQARPELHKKPEAVYIYLFVICYHGDFQLKKA